MRKKTKAVKLKENHVYVGPAAVGAFKVLKRFKNEDGDVKLLTVSTESGEEKERFEMVIAGACQEIDDVLQFDEAVTNRGYAFTLGYLAGNATVVADIPFTSQNSFDHTYRGIKKQEPDKDNESYSVHKCGDTWSYALRVFFPVKEGVDEAKLVLPPSVTKNMSNHDSTTKRVSDNGWAWKILSMGFDISQKHNSELIRSFIPDENKDAFDKGLQI